jgi:putative glycerol-1-phosphate prenyltransferase
MERTTQRLDHLLRNAKASGKKLLAVLIDPDKPGSDLGQFAARAESAGADVFLVGGSLVMHDDMDTCIHTLRANSGLPIYLFPSSPAQIRAEADGILFLSLISGRNPDLLIGKHIEAAPLLAKTSLHVMSTGYMLIDCGTATTAHYMSQSLPIPFDKPEIAQATALAGQYLGMSTIYMDAGSGAARSISSEMVSSVAEAIDIPLIIGGGVREAIEAERLCQAGADMLVVGNALESNPSLLQDISIAVHSAVVKG